MALCNRVDWSSELKINTPCENWEPNYTYFNNSVLPTYHFILLATVTTYPENIIA